jgi:predicted metalloendopeptidase
MDPATRPGDDFFRYANGTWINKTQIPPDKPAYSLRLPMTDLTEHRLHAVVICIPVIPTTRAWRFPAMAAEPGLLQMRLR